MNGLVQREAFLSKWPTTTLFFIIFYSHSSGLHVPCATTAPQPDNLIRASSLQNVKMTIPLSWESLISARRPPWRQITQSHASGFWLFDAFRKENTALRHRLQPFARTPPDYVSGNMQHKVTSCFPFLEHYRLSTSIKISSRLYMNSRFTPEYSTTGRHLRPDMRRKKVFSAQSDFFLSRD